MSPLGAEALRFFGEVLPNGSEIMILAFGCSGDV